MFLYNVLLAKYEHELKSKDRDEMMKLHEMEYKMKYDRSNS